jgi:hypothetical protein
VSRFDELGETMWRELIQSLDPSARFTPGASTDELARVEEAIKVRLPEELRELLAESDGVLREDGQHLIWSTDEIVTWNVALRTESGYLETYMPLDALLFFADAGVDGIKFGYGLVQGAVKMTKRIYAWHPIGDDREWKADGVEDYLERWLTGKLTV